MKPKKAIITVAIVVGGIRLWMQLRGKTTTPFSEWAIGYGVLIIFLAFLAESYPPAAAPLAGTVIVGDVLKNGAGLFEDITAAIGQAGSGQSIFKSNPFSPGSQQSSTPGDALSPTQINPSQTVIPYPARVPVQQINIGGPGTSSNPVTGWKP